MTQPNTYFKIKNGVIEIEYSGPLSEVNQRYDQAFQWASKYNPTPNTSKEIESKPSNHTETKSTDRGGPRKPLYGKKIDELIKAGFFKNRKSLDEVIKGLEPKNVPTKGLRARKAVLINLRRKIAKEDAILQGAKEENMWYFWVD